MLAGHEVGRAAGPRQPSLMLVSKSVIPINLDSIHFNFMKRRRLSATLNGFHQAHKISDSWWFPVVQKVSESCRFSLLFTVFIVPPVTNNWCTPVLGNLSIFFLLT
jgi:hypothetical protein